MFLVGVVTLALVALPYAVGRPAARIDRWTSYALLAIVGWIGFVWRVVDLFMRGAFAFDEPVRGVHQRPRPVDRRPRSRDPLAGDVYGMTREPAYR